MPRHDKKLSPDHFSHSAAVYARFRHGYSPATLAYLRERCQISTHTRLVDIACGPGIVFREFLGEARSIIGLDFSPGMLAQARKSFLGSPGLLLTQAKAEELPLPAACIDLVTVGQAIHWLDLERFLPELQRVIRPGGWFAAISKYPTAAEPYRFRVEHLIHQLKIEFGQKPPPELTYGADVGNLLGLEAFGFTDYRRCVFSWVVDTPIDVFLEGWLVRFDQRGLPREAREAFEQGLRGILAEHAGEGPVRETYYDYILTARHA